MTRCGLLHPSAAQGPPPVPGVLHFLIRTRHTRIPRLLTALWPLAGTIPAMRRNTGGVARQARTASSRAGSSGSCRATPSAAMTSANGWPPCGSRRTAVRCQSSRCGRAGIQTLEQIIVWQAGPAAWHLGEARPLGDLAGRASEPEGPAAAPTTGQTISGETTPQWGGGGHPPEPMALSPIAPARPGRAPGLGAPAGTGITTAAWDRLTAAFALPHQGPSESDLHIARGGPATRRPTRRHSDSRPESRRETVAAIVRHRLECPGPSLPGCLGVARGTIAAIVRGSSRDGSEFMGVHLVS